MTLDLRQFKDALDRYLTMPPEDATDADEAYDAAMAGTADGDDYSGNEWIINRITEHVNGLEEYGRVAFECGEPLEANPFEEWQPEWNHWRRGWSYASGSLAATDPDVAVGRGDTPEYIDGFCDALDEAIEKAKVAK